MYRDLGRVTQSSATAVRNVMLDLKFFSAILQIVLICITVWFEVSKI